jgi:hypothetical protein
MDLLLRELQSGAARLGGTSMTGTIQIGEADLNRLLIPAESPLPLKVELRSGNRVVVSYGPLSAGVHLPPHVDLSHSLEVTFELTSAMVAWALKRFVRQRYIRIDGSRAIVDLAQIPALQPYLRVLRSVTRLAMTTRDGRLHVEFLINIAQHAPRRLGVST